MSKLTGLDDFLDVVAILRDPSKYDAKLKELKSLIAQYTEVCEAVVKLAEVDDYTRNIKVQNEEAIKKVEDAKKVASEILENATKKAEQLTGEAKTTLEKARKKSSELSNKETALTSRQEELDKALAQFTKDKASLDEQQKSVEQLKVELASKRSKLLAAIG